MGALAGRRTAERQIHLGPGADPPLGRGRSLAGGRAMKRWSAAALSLAALGMLAMSGTQAEEVGRVTLPGPTLGVAWGVLYGTGGVQAETFLPQLQYLGPGWAKAHLLWSQVE